MNLVKIHSKIDVSEVFGIIYGLGHRIFQFDAGEFQQFQANKSLGLKRCDQKHISENENLGIKLETIW